MSIEIVSQKCVGCKLCIPACPYAAIDMINNIATINYDKCTLCGACVTECKFEAIILRRHHEDRARLKAYKGVWVFCEQKKAKRITAGEGERAQGKTSSLIARGAYVPASLAFASQVRSNPIATMAW